MMMPDFVLALALSLQINGPTISRVTTFLECGLHRRRTMSARGHLRRINGADGVSGSHPIAPSKQ
jgi:hypothetical protein